LLRAIDLEVIAFFIIKIISWTRSKIYLLKIAKARVMLELSRQIRFIIIIKNLAHTLLILAN
jgi:hypothetical protein